MPVPLPIPVIPQKISLGAKQTILYPQVTFIKDPTFQLYMNQSIYQSTYNLIRKQMQEAPQIIVEMDGYFEIKNNQRDVFSLTMGNYAYPYQAAHGMTYLKSLSFDLEQKKLLRLQDLFKPGVNYIERLSKIIHEQIKERDLPLIQEFTEIKPDQDFYLADKTLVIYFQLYELVPYAYGFPMFPISIYEIQDIIIENGPLGRLIAN